MGRPLRILCTGDLHIGRRPSRLPSSVDARPCSCAAVWRDIVEYARRERVDVVLISGDLVDRENRFYEAYGPLESGLRELERAGIDTLAVAGNHDFDVLPRLADQFDTGAGRGRFRLLGRGGQWERHTLRREGVAVLQVDGWSFPSESVTANPLHAFRPVPGLTADPSDRDAPLVGLLHCDLDQPQSRYAPVRLSDLAGTGHALWLLGHVHQHKVHQLGAGVTAMYPGSPQAMDPGECGTHGAWLVELDGRRPVVKPVHLPMSKVRYDVVAVDVSGVATEQQLQDRLVGAARAHAATFADACGPLRYTSLRMTLTGRTPLHRRLRACCGPIIEDLEIRLGDFFVRVERVECDTRPPFELTRLAVGNDAPAVLARVLLELDASGGGTGGVATGGREPLVAETLARIAEVWGARSYQPVARDAEPEAAESRRLLSRQAYLLLDELLAQREQDEVGAK